MTGATAAPSSVERGPSAAPSARADRILVVGTARAGTSWLARSLGQAAHTRYYPEPDNIDSEHDGKEPGYLGFGPYPVVDPGEAPPSLASLWDFIFLGRIPASRRVQLAAGRRFVKLPRTVRDPMFRLAAKTMSHLPGGPSYRVVKSIYVMFALDWIIDRYNPQIVLIQRNPLNVVSSWMQLGISSFDLSSRPELQERHVSRIGVGPPAPDAPPLDLAAWSVGLLTTVLAEAHAQHPEWPLYVHEDLCERSQDKIRRIYDDLGLTWTEASTRFLQESDRPGEGLRPVRVTSEQPDRWKQRLTSEQATRIQEILSRFPSRGWIRQPAAAAS
jgi:Sulfotransferase family